MERNRRFFLKIMAAAGATGAGAGGLWAATAQSRSTRWLRRMFADSSRKVSPAPMKPEPITWPDNQITIGWLGHATVLINFYGIKILTDPALSDRVGISLGIGTAGPKRYIAPALQVTELPPIDVVLLSHAHMDHMDLPTLNRLPRNVRVFTAKATADLLEEGRQTQVTELGWSDSATYRSREGELRVQAFEVKHWGQRWPSERVRGYNGYILRREGKALLFGGDTAKTGQFAELRSQGPFQAAIMPIGAYRPWIWNHCTPEQALEMANAARARYIVPVHHQTFRLSDEPMKEPIHRLEEALASESERLALREVGQSFACKMG